MTNQEFERLRTLVMGAIAIADTAQIQLQETAKAMRAAYHRVAELEAERDRWRKISDGMAGCLDSSCEAGDLLNEYEQAVRGD